MQKKTQNLFTSVVVMLLVLFLQQYAVPQPVQSSAVGQGAGKDGGGGGIGTNGGANVAYGGTGTSVEVPAGFVRVKQVVDGDTVKVMLNGAEQTVRLIGINTPETVDPRKPVECFGKEASAHAKELLSGKNVRLEADATQDDTDKYGRILRYLVLEDGTNFSLAMISDGYAYEYTYSRAYKYQKQFRAAQATAKAEGRGLWNAETCNGVK